MATRGIEPVAVFRASAVAIVPEAARLRPADWQELEGIVEAALDERPPVARRLRLLLRLLDVFALVRFRRRFSALDPILRARLLASLQDSPLALLRRGFWGLKTLVLMGYYGRAGAGSEIGYRADLRGWPARRPQPGGQHE
jgi:hypothetical protein